MAASVVELCAGAGGQALGLEGAGFGHECLVDHDPHCCATLRLNRDLWSVRHGDVQDFDARAFRGIDLIAGGLPCPPFSVAGKQLGADDERDLFPAALRIIDEARPRAVLIENVRGFLGPAFAEYREAIRQRLKALGYQVRWRLLNASDYGLPQLRPRVAIIALKNEIASDFTWPEPQPFSEMTVGETLFDLMAENGWKGADAWRTKASRIAPTIVGGSKKHGGPDLGPTRARKAWAELGVDGLGLANAAPEPDFDGMPRLTVKMVARLQGFPDDWEFSGKKTASYRQVGNAFPPPVAKALGVRILSAMTASSVVVRRVA